MPDVTSPGADFLARERERQKMRDLTQHDRETFPGTAGGRALPASPLEHRGRSSSRGGLFPALSPSPVGVGTPQIHHVTAAAVASQGIADGGATVQWGAEASAPTERRGFGAFSTQLVAGAVGDIPVDLTGEMEIVLDGLWESFRADGEITITRTRDGVAVSRTFDLGPVRSRLFGGNTVGWKVQAGDTVTVDLPNGSGASQTLSEATVEIRIIGTPSELAGSSSAPPEEPITTFRDSDSEQAPDTVSVTIAGDGSDEYVTSDGPVVAGDLLVAVVTVGWVATGSPDNDGTVTLPAGWNEIEGWGKVENSGVSDPWAEARLLWRRATQADEDGETSYTFTATQTRTSNGIVSIRATVAVLQAENVPSSGGFGATAMDSQGSSASISVEAPTSGAWTLVVGAGIYNALSSTGEDSEIDLQPPVAVLAAVFPSGGQARAGGADFGKLDTPGGTVEMTTDGFITHTWLAAIGVD